MMEDQEFFKTGGEVSVAQINLTMSKFMDMRRDYEEAKTKASAIYAELKKVESSLLEMLTASGLEKYSVPDIGTVSVTSSLSFNVPKTLDDKRALYGYIKSKHGSEVLESMLSINSRTLNSFLREEYNSLAEEGVNPVVAGVNQPTEMQALRFTKARRK